MNITMPEIQTLCTSVFFAKAEAALDAGFTVIVDAAFMSLEQRKKIQSIARNRAIPFHGFWLMAPVDVMRKRLQQRYHDVSDATVAVLEKQLRRDKGVIEWIPIDTNSAIEKTVALLKSELG